MAETPAFVRALGRLPSGLYILSSGEGESLTGSLLSLVQQVGFEPRAPAITPDGAFVYVPNRFSDTLSVIDTLADLVSKLDGVDANRALHTIEEFNNGVDASNAFDPTRLDGRRTRGLSIDKMNWANTLSAPPFKAYPVTCGITFTYAGLLVDKNAAVLNRDGVSIPGLFACGEMIGDVFSAGYPGGSGLTSGAVFGRIAGRGAAL